MSRYSKCEGCWKDYHYCGSCGLTDSESRCYENGLCSGCYRESGAEAVYFKLLEAVGIFEEQEFRLVKEFISAKSGHEKPSPVTEERNRDK